MSRMIQVFYHNVYLVLQPLQPLKRFDKKFKIQSVRLHLTAFKSLLVSRQSPGAAAPPAARCPFPTRPCSDAGFRVLVRVWQPALARHTSSD